MTIDIDTLRTDADFGDALELIARRAALLAKGPMSARSIQLRAICSAIITASVAVGRGQAAHLDRQSHNEYMEWVGREIGQLN